VEAGAALDDVLRTMIAEKHSRLPVYRGSPEKIVAFCITRTCCRFGRSGGAPYALARPAAVPHWPLAAPAPGVPETKPLSQMLEQFRAGHSHMAMVVDEFGTIVGC